MSPQEIQLLFDYNSWANRRSLGAAEKLVQEQFTRRMGSSFSSVRDTLAHIYGAEWIWLERWHGVSPAGADAWSQWKVDGCPDLPTLSQRWQEIIARRAAFLAGTDEDGLAAELPFKLLNGDASSLPLVSQMQHVVNHATLHRGQVVGMIRQLGIVPPATDLLFYLRREIPA